MSSTYMSGSVVTKAISQRARLRSGQSRTAGVITLVVLGGLGLLLALTIGSSKPDAVSTCNGQAMSPQDMCEIYSSDGGGGTYTYQQMVDQQNSQAAIWRVIGFGLAGLCLVLAVPVTQSLDPSKPWGRSLATPCPRCNKNNLEERKTTHSVTRGRVTRSYTGIVTLCTPECGYSTVRRP